MAMFEWFTAGAKSCKYHWMRGTATTGMRSKSEDMANPSQAFGDAVEPSETNLRNS